MDQPNRKSVADVAASRERAVSAPPTSPETFIELDVTSKNGVRTYKGRFKFKVPTMGQRVDISALQAQYLQQLSNVDTNGATIAEALAYLAITIDAKSAPEWWTASKGGIELYDYPPLLTLYAKARAYEATFLGIGTEPAPNEGAPAGGSDADAPSDVGDDVPPTAQRRQVLATFGKGGDRAGADDPGDGSDPG